MPALTLISWDDKRYDFRFMRYSWLVSEAVKDYIWSSRLR